MPEILLFGAGGQLGQHLARDLLRVGNVRALHHADCDIGDPEAVQSAIAGGPLHLVVNASAYTNVDGAETDCHVARQVNAIGPGLIAVACAHAGVPMIHFSTDYVFDGSGTHFWTELDTPNPLNAYGRSKLEGENNIRAQLRNHVILRISWLYSALGNNFAKTILRAAQTRDSLTVVDDQFGAPTPASLVSKITATIATGLLAGGTLQQIFGTYHLAPEGVTTWHGFAQTLVRSAAAAGHRFKVEPESVRSVTTAQFPRPARRPQNSRLSTRKITEMFNLSLPGWNAALEQELPNILGQL